jgi:uncharacterized protein (TIGR00369 family)
VTDIANGAVPGIEPGERFKDIDGFDDARHTGPNLWRTLGYRRTDWQPGRTTIEWDADPDYCFRTAGGPVVQGGMVTAILDAAMGGACWSVLDLDQAFLTADLRVEFLRSSRPGLLRATGTVIRRTRRVVFCAAELFDAAGTLLATSRCTQVVLPADGQAGRETTVAPNDGPAVHQDPS